MIPEWLQGWMGAKPFGFEGKGAIVVGNIPQPQCGNALPPFMQTTRRKKRKVCRLSKSAGFGNDSSREPYIHISSTSLP
jgi:hypothetical protein